jgi:hypothetical protein
VAPSKASAQTNAQFKDDTFFAPTSHFLILMAHTLAHQLLEPVSASLRPILDNLVAMLPALSVSTHSHGLCSQPGSQAEGSISSVLSGKLSDACHLSCESAGNTSCDQILFLHQFHFEHGTKGTPDTVICRHYLESETAAVTSDHQLPSYVNGGPALFPYAFIEVTEESVTEKQPQAFA